MNEFDRLFNQYFGDDEGKNEKIIKLMNDLNESDGDNPEETLGRPDTKRVFERDGVIFVESTWNTDIGTIVKIETKEELESSSEYYNKTMNISLEEQLESAKKLENYEECARLRDAIIAKEEEKIAGENKNNKNNKGIPKKGNKDKASENLDNKGFPDDKE